MEKRSDDIMAHFYYPNLTYFQIRNIVNTQENMLERQLANNIHKLSGTVFDNNLVFYGESTFKPFDGPGYQFFYDSLSAYLEAFHQGATVFLKDKSPLGFFTLWNNLSKAIGEVVSNAKKLPEEELLKLYCEVDLLNEPYYLNKLIDELVNSDNTVKFVNDVNLKESIKDNVKSHVEYVTKILFIGDTNRGKESKEDITEADLELAIKFTEKLDEFIKSISKQRIRENDNV